MTETTAELADQKWAALSPMEKEAVMVKEAQVVVAEGARFGAAIVEALPSSQKGDDTETVADAIVNLLHWYASRHPHTASGDDSDKATAEDPDGESIDYLLAMALRNFHEERTEAKMPVIDLDVSTP